MAPQIVHRLGTADEQIDGIADQIGRRLVPGIEQEDAIVNELELRELLACAGFPGEGAGADQRR